MGFSPTVQSASGATVSSTQIGTFTVPGTVRPPTPDVTYVVLSFVMPSDDVIIDIIY